ncbi:MAG: peptidoglycan editing factor PgeF [Parachlamydiales bacterium]|jgi:hypothetical protein
MENDTRHLEWIEYDLFEKYPQMVCKTYLRHGGFSTGPLAALNLSNKVGDHPDSVKANRALVLEDLKVKNLVFALQTHSDRLVEVTEENLTNTLEADGLYTRVKNIALGITHADCQAAVFFDPVQQVLGVVHAGWKGLVLDLYGKMVKTLQEEMGVLPENLLVAISPSLGPDHAEFKDYKQDFPEEFWPFQVKDRPKYFNLWKVAIMQLARAGVKENQIEVAQSCTFCEEKDFYSYRRQKLSGRHGTLAALL